MRASKNLGTSQPGPLIAEDDRDANPAGCSINQRWCDHPRRLHVGASRTRRGAYHDRAAVERIVPRRHDLGVVQDRRGPDRHASRLRVVHAGELERRDQHQMREARHTHGAGDGPYVFRVARPDQHDAQRGSGMGVPADPRRLTGGHGPLSSLQHP